MLRNAIAPDLLELLESVSAGDVDFYSQYARISGGPVLVLLCGTGRIAIAIARQGIPVIGLDSEAAVIDYAKRKAQEAGVSRVMFVRGDATNFVSDSKHPLVLIPGGALQRLMTLEEQSGCLAAARLALQVGGKLVLDLPLLEPGLSAAEPPVLRRLPGSSDRAAVVHRHRRFDGARQVIEEMTACEWLDPNGQVERKEYAATSTRFATPGEIHLLLAACGFVPEFYGGFDRQALLPGAARLVVEAGRS
jgi:precorrin-6B methylase 2